MIKYALKCAQGHKFESWFKSGADYERLEKSQMLTCVTCGITTIQKALMAPSVAPLGNIEAQSPHEAMVKATKENLKGAKNVGWQFAREARAIHYGDKEEAQIYGRTEPAEAIDLLREGINIAPLPFDPDAKEN